MVGGRRIVGVLSEVFYNLVGRRGGERGRYDNWAGWWVVGAGRGEFWADCICTACTVLYFVLFAWSE